MKLELEGRVSPTERAKEIAYRVLTEGHDPLLACRELADFREELPRVSDEIISTFTGVASEVDGLPIGGEREQWSAEALRFKDVEVADYRERVREPVEQALRGLLASLSRRH